MYEFADPFVIGTLKTVTAGCDTDGRAVSVSFLVTRILDCL